MKRILLILILLLFTFFLVSHAEEPACHKIEGHEITEQASLFPSVFQIKKIKAFLF